MPGVPPGQNRIRLVLPFPKIQRTRESDTRSQSYRCLKFFLTVELWKFITNCTKTQINWNLCQFCVLFNALHAGKFSWFLKLFWYVNQRCKFGLRSTPSAVRAIFESRYLTICFEILCETSQSCSMKARMHVGKFSWFLKVFWHVNQRCKVELKKKKNSPNSKPRKKKKKKKKNPITEKNFPERAAGSGKKFSGMGIFRKTVLTWVFFEIYY